MTDRESRGPVRGTPDNVPVWPGDASRGEIEILREEVVWGNPVVRLFNDQVRFPASENGKPVEDWQFRLGHAEGKVDGVVAVPIADDDRILLVRQFRHPVRMWMRELPRGGRERGEAPPDAVKRELREEIGREARSLHFLGRVVTDSGQLTGVPYLFAARVAEERGRRPEKTEAMDRVIPYTFRALRAACRSGEIVDAFTLAALTRLEPHFDGDRFAFRPSEAPPPLDE